MLKRATAVTLPLALAACSAAGPYEGDVPQAPSSATREFGESAELVTTDVARGVPVKWEVTVSEPLLASGADTSITCYPVTLTPTFIGDYPTDFTVTVPWIAPVAGDIYANYVPDTSVCGQVETPVNGYSGDLKVGKAMHAVVASWSGDGIPATGVIVTSAGQKVRWEDEESEAG